MISPPGDRPRGPLPDPVFVRKVELKDLTERELFKEVDENHLQQLLDNRYSRICTLGARKQLWPTRREIDHLYVILKGYVVISTTSRFDKGDTFLAWRGPEQIIGEMRPERAEPSTAVIRACGPCEFLEMRNDVVMGDMATNNPVIYRNIANLLLKKMASENYRSDVIKKSSLTEMQVAQTLLYLADERCKKDELQAAGPVTIPGTILQNELAAYIGVGREGVNHALSNLKNGGVISYPPHKKEVGISDRPQSKEIVILDRDELREIARNPIKAKSYRTRKSRHRKN